MVTTAIKRAAFFAFVGTMLVAAMLVWNLVFTAVNIARGLVPAITLVPAVVYAFAAVGVVSYFWVVYRSKF